MGVWKCGNNDFDFLLPFETSMNKGFQRTVKKMCLYKNKNGTLSNIHIPQYAFHISK
jgi:hypothetical protein